MQLLKRFGMYSSVFIFLFLSATAVSGNYLYPPNAGVIDVTQAPYNADKTGKTDATAAIQKALDGFPNGNRIIFLPEGTYLVSNTLKWGPSTDTGCGTCQKRTSLEGQGRDRTIIKLKNNAAGYQDPKNRKAVIWTGNRPAQRFRNSIWNLTVNTGTGNPGAAGIQYNTSNQGSMRNVLIVSEDRQGVVGLDGYFTDEIGPGFIYNLEVIGFDRGVDGYLLNSLTFQNLKLSHQNVAGFKNSNHVVSIRGFISDNAVPAVENNGVMMLMDAELKGTGAASGVAAISNTGSLYARSISGSGYARLIDNSAGTKTGVGGMSVAEFVSHPIQSLFPSPATSLHLPIQDVPELPWDLVSEWVSPMDFGAVGNGTTDDTKAIQDAIDAGKTTVYFPGGKHFKFTTLFLRGKVRRLIGCEGNLRNGTIEFVEGDAPVVAVERINSLYYPTHIIHKSSRSLIVRHISDMAVTGSGSGNLFIEDIVASPFHFEQSGQRIWAWQVNPEGRTETNIINKGGVLWLMGLKTENASTKLATSDGGFTEVLGGHIYAQGEEKKTPLFTIDNAAASFAAVRQITFNNRYFPELVAETRDGSAESLLNASAGNTLYLFTGYQKAISALVTESMPGNFFPKDGWQVPFRLHSRGIGGIAVSNGDASVGGYRFFSLLGRRFNNQTRLEIP